MRWLRHLPQPGVAHAHAHGHNDGHGARHTQINTSAFRSNRPVLQTDRPHAFAQCGRASLRLRVGALHFFEPSAKRVGKRQLPISQRREGTRAPAYSYMQHVMRNRAGLQKHARAAGRLRDLPCTPTADKPVVFSFALNGD